MDDSDGAGDSLQLNSVRSEDGGLEVKGDDLGGEYGWNRSFVVLWFSGSGVLCSADWRWSSPGMWPEMVTRSSDD